MRPFNKNKALDLLQDSLHAAKGRQGEGFFLRLAEHLMGEALRQDPDLLNFDDGFSVMEGCGRVDPEIALLWRRMRGAAAWTANPGREPPFLSLINPNGKVIGDIGFTDLSGLVPEKDREAFFDEVIGTAIILRKEDVADWDTTPNFTSDQIDLLRKQTLLVRYCLSDFDGMAAEKTRALLRHEGLISTKTIKQVKDIEFIANPEVSPLLPLFDDYNNSTEKGEARWKPWHDAWVDDAKFDHAPQVLSYLEAHKVPLDEAKEAIFFQTVSRKVSQFERNEESGRTIWQWATDVFTQENQWDLEDDDGHLLWQTLIYESPILLTAMIQSPPPGGLGQKSKKGSGIWDEVVPAINLSSRRPVSPKALSRLAKRVKPELLSRDSNEPLVWNWWPRKDAPVDAYIQETGKIAPDLWLGNAKQQRSGIYQVLSYLCDQDKRQNALRSAACLLHPDLDLSGATPEVLVGARILHKVIWETPEFRDQCPLIREDAPAIGKIKRDTFQARFTKQLELVKEHASQYGEYDDALGRRLLSEFEHLFLSEASEPIKHAARAPSRRF